MLRAVAPSSHRPIHSSRPSILIFFLPRSIYSEKITPFQSIQFENLHKGADVNAKGETAVAEASKRGEVEIVRLLKAHGAKESPEKGYQP